jgi:hypothetical protein
MAVMRRFVAAEIVGQHDVQALFVLLDGFTTTGHGGSNVASFSLFFFRILLNCFFNIEKR